MTASSAFLSLTAAELVDRIRARVGVPWLESSVDTFKAGDPHTAVRGVAVVMMATLPVLKRAVEAGTNFVITHEPTFYDHLDEVEPLERANDVVYRAKQTFIADHGLVIWRFHDHMHRMQPDLVLSGMVEGLGWKRWQSSQHPKIFEREIIVADLVRELVERLPAPSVRVVGRQSLRAQRIAFSPGYCSLATAQHFFTQENADVLVTGETREWESVEYLEDLNATGRSKAMIILGHIPSEEMGMEACARWLRTLAESTPVTFLSTPNPFAPL